MRGMTYVTRRYLTVYVVCYTLVRHRRRSGGDTLSTKCCSTRSPNSGLKSFLLQAALVRSRNAPAGSRRCKFRLPLLSCYRVNQRNSLTLHSCYTDYDDCHSNNFSSTSTPNKNSHDSH